MMKSMKLNDVLVCPGSFISVEGFTDGALKRAREHGIYISGKAELNKLLKKYGVKTIKV